MYSLTGEARREGSTEDTTADADADASDAPAKDQLDKDNKWVLILHVGTQASTDNGMSPFTFNVETQLSHCCRTVQVSDCTTIDHTMEQTGLTLNRFCKYQIKARFWNKSVCYCILWNLISIFALSHFFFRGVVYFDILAVILCYLSVNLPVKE